MGATQQDFRTLMGQLDELLGVGRNFDIVGRKLTIAGRSARLWVVNGYAQDALLERMISGWLALTDLQDAPDAESFLQRHVSACDASVQRDWDKAVTAVFSGKTLLVLEGYDGGMLLEAKQFPLRGVAEPDSSKVLRGAHDGFVENIMKNAALLRRRIRSPQLTLERLTAGERSQADIALCYMEGEADPKLVEEIRRKVQAIDVRSVSMGQESIFEALHPGQWYNPFPKVRYTERPDVATACIMEGDVLLMVDNSPAVMILPTTIFSFTESVNDYYFPPVIGTYLQIVRTVVLLMTLFVTPLWYLLVKDPERLHESFRFLLIQDEYFVPLIVQLLLVELIVDLLKLAALNTPNALSSSFSMLGALILGDFAVQSRWLVPEVLVYMAFVAIANYAQYSYELAYASKLCRMGLLICIWLGDIWGFVLGVVGVLVLLATTKPLVGKGYLYPLFPFNGKDLKALLHRRPISRRNT